MFLISSKATVFFISETVVFNVSGCFHLCNFRNILTVRLQSCVHWKRLQPDLLLFSAHMCRTVGIKSCNVKKCSAWFKLISLC